MSIEVKLNMPLPPEGYEYTGEFRQALAGEPWLDSDGKFRKMESATVGMYVILRKKKKTRPPVPGDIKDAPIPCRVSHDGFSWMPAYLVAVFPWMKMPYAVNIDHSYATSKPERSFLWRYCTIEVDE